jgi:hypothetical protein
MALTNHKQSMEFLIDHQEDFRALSYDLKELKDENFSLNQGSAIAKDADRWDQVDRRKKRGERRETRTTINDTRASQGRRNGDFVSGRMGLEISEEPRRVDLDPSVSPMKWWIEIFTANPFCLYYFGDFRTFQEARILKQGFKQDLLDEGASIICLAVKYCCPRQLTIPPSEMIPQEFKHLQSELAYYQA